MLDHEKRTAILNLHEQGHGPRSIARALKVSRNSVRKVLRSASAQVPPLARAEKAEPHREEILEQYVRCKGNLVRVHEELLACGAELSYQALTAFCRRHGIGHKEPVPAGQYHFEPGQEMQHDTSPHTVNLAGQPHRAQTASMALCYSRRLFFQFYPTFTRFECKVFLTDALQYNGGAAEICMIDNTHVVVLRGTGLDMVPVPEMAAFAERYGFQFKAHEKGDANRSARVERPFSFIENNFLAGRSFESWDDLNRQAVAWCDKVNATFKRHLRASPRELFAVEQPQLRPLPLWVPKVYVLHHRIVDLEGYVSVHTNRYSVPARWIGRRVEARETKDQIEIYDGPRQIAVHPRLVEPLGRRLTAVEHRPPRGQGIRRHDPSVEEKALLQAAPELAAYVASLKKKASGRATRQLRQLLRMVREYPRQILLQTADTALHYGLYDLDRLEKLVLRQIATDYFPLPFSDNPSPSSEDPHD
jgi:transposase